MRQISDIALRTALPQDREAVLDLLQHLNRSEAAISGDRLTDRAAAEASYATLIERIARLQGRLVVAEAEGQVVGAFGLVVETDAAHVEASVRRYGAVTNLVVHPAFRKRGIGRRLLEEAERLTRAIGLRRLVIAVLAGNLPAERAYRTLGFEEYAKVYVKPLG